MSTEESLIDEVKAHKCLYDSKHLFYKNVKIRNRAWNEIAAKLRIKPEAARKKWRLLSDRYKRKRKETSDATRNQRKNWRFETQMSFLDDCEEDYLSEAVDDDKDDRDDDSMQSFSEDGPLSFPSNTFECTSKNEHCIKVPCTELSELLQEVESAFSENTPIRTFYHSLALQIEEANMPSKDIHNLQIQLYNAVQKVVKRN